uniref:Coagulation factor IX-like n=1 Tax=Coturnix japonica TaxID=93934 RepID=A0A8C2TXM3_COTJA
SSSVDLLRVFCSLQAQLFMRKDAAHEVLRVHKRANYFLEEILPGNLERECNEEKCSFEEAKEIFHSQEKTTPFCCSLGLNPCTTNPCKNGGVCKIRRYSYFCICPPKFGGENCEKEKLECWYKNGGCGQYCWDSGSLQVQCSCAKGYTLHEDGKKCVQAAPFPCGLIRARRALEEVRHESTGRNRTGAELHAPGGVHESDRADGSGTAQHPLRNSGDPTELSQTRITGGTLCHRGQCPWQVLIRDSRDIGFCGGSLINSRWVITAAHFLSPAIQNTVPDNIDGEIPTEESTEQKIGVERSWIHPHYDSNNYNGDIALLYLSSEVVYNEFAIPICLPSPNLAALLAEEGQVGMVSGWGATHSRGSTLRFLMRVRLPVVSMETCQQSTSRLVTDNMFCAGYGTEAADACKGDSGGPFAVPYQNTWFLLGIVSWGDGCAERGKYGVYTRVSNYIPWIKETVESVADSEKFSINFS